MPEMDEHISERERIKRKIAGTITGIAAHDHFKTGIFQSGSHGRLTAASVLRETGGQPVVPPSFSGSQ